MSPAEHRERSRGGADWATIVQRRLAEIKAAGRWRAPKPFDGLGPVGTLGGRVVVSFASNDYLGLSCHPAVTAAAHAAIDRWGTGAGASRLITGSRPVHHDLETALAEWKGAQAAVCFPTGFAANLAVLSVLGETGTNIFSDELNHASIIDGCRLSHAAVAVYRHNDAEHLDALLSSSDRPSIVVTDSVFSMDGDVAPLVELADACRRHGALLVLDEAHAVLGPTLTSATLGCTVVRVGTMSKTLGALGGFVVGDQPIIDLLVNQARPYIFTTGLSPADAAAALAAVVIVTSSEGDALRARLATHIDRVRAGHRTPIVPIVVGSEQRAIDASAALLRDGLWVPAIRPPTVAPGTSRLRVTLSAAHSDAQVDALVDALARVADDALPAA